MNTLGLRALLVAAAAASLVACGGDANVSGIQPSTFTIAGTAATGLAAPDGVDVTITCASGAGTGKITGGAGNYSVTITSGVAPCLVSATFGTPAQTIRSISSPAQPGSGASVVANLTPFTEMVVQSLISLKNAGSAANLLTSAVPSVTDMQIVSVYTVGVINNALKSANGGSSVGLLPENTDLIGGVLRAATSTNPTAGNAYDTALDTLKTAITAGKVQVSTIVNGIISVSDDLVNSNDGSTASGSTGSTGGSSS